MKELFAIKYLYDDIYRITDLTGVNSYLVLGNKKAALLDTGCGLGNIREVVESITQLPVIVLLSHGHVDHAGGVSAFPDVWIHDSDRELLAVHSRKEFRMAYCRLAVSSEMQSVVVEKNFIDEDMPALHSLKENDQIDLGGRVIEIVGFAGHTLGSVGFYDETTDTLFSGDGAKNSTFLFADHCLSVAKYREILCRIREKYSLRMKHYVICHDYDEVPLTCLDHVIACCDRILSGEASGIYFDFPFEPLHSEQSYWAVDPQKTGVENFGNIIYNKYNVT